MKFHCDKLCSGPCCSHLIVALNAHCIWNGTHEKTHVCAFCALTETIDGVRHRFLGEHPERLAAIDAAGDPAKLAELMATGSDVRGARYEFIASGDMIEWCKWGKGKDLVTIEIWTMEQARAKLLRIMSTLADVSSREQVERIIRGEA